MVQSTLSEIIVHRRQIRDAIYNRGDNPYPQDGHRTHSILEALNEQHEAKVVVCGRIRSVRQHGKVHFMDIEDETGSIQLMFKVDHVTDFEQLSEFDTGDFMRVSGIRICTRTGQESVLCDTFDMLSKALRPLPDSHYGFTDTEERYRRRYLDLIMNPDVQEVFRQRSRIISSVRRTLEEFGFMEVETPTLQPLYGGANARPFTTHINAFDMDMYLKISDELYLKRLVVGGFDKVYEIDKDFRNEGISSKHNPEFTMMECYAAYWDYEDMMRLTEMIYRNAAIASTGTDIVPYTRVDEHSEDHVELNFRDPWKRLTMHDAIQDHYGFNPNNLSDDELREAVLKYQGITPSDDAYAKLPASRGLLIAEIFETLEDRFVQPTFIIDFPRETTALCKPHRSKPGLIERFEPYILGMEVGNAYTELNDPVLQRQFMEDERGDEAHPIDEDFIEALEYGMPPTGGLGLGIDRMVMLLTNQRKIRDVLLFPTMKPRQ